MNAPRGVPSRRKSSSAKPSGETVIVTIFLPREALGVVGVPLRLEVMIPPKTAA